MAEVADGGGGKATEFEVLSYLIYADRPEQVRAAAGPWAGVARVVEQASSVLEDGQTKLAEVWRSSAGQLYLSKMGEVTKAMRDISVIARHNGQVMDAAADALDAKQKDFGMLSTAPIPEDARTGFARAIVRSLDESYQQAAADFRPVPPPSQTDISMESSRTAGPSHIPSRQDSTLGSGPAPSGDSAHSDGAAPSMQQLPAWVPTQPVTAGPSDTSGSAPAPGSGPQLQGITSGASPGGGWGTTPGGLGSMPGATPSGGPPTTPGAQPPPPAATGPLPYGPGRAGAGPAEIQPRSFGPPAGQQLRPRGRPQTPGAPYPGEAAGRPATGARPAAGTRVGSGEPGAMVGGMPAGAASGAGRVGWQGYRRAAERFPTSEKTAVPPLISAAPAEEPELVSTDYADEYGNRITIRRPA